MSTSPSLICFHKAGHMNERLCAVRGLMRAAGSGKTSVKFRLTGEREREGNVCSLIILKQEDPGGRRLHWSLPVLRCGSTRWATICSACWSTSPPYCNLSPSTGGRGSCGPGGCSTCPGGASRSGGWEASRRSWAGSGCGPGSPPRRRRGARGGRARSSRSAAGRKSCAGRH